MAEVWHNNRADIRYFALAVGGCKGIRDFSAKRPYSVLGIQFLLRLCLHHCDEQTHEPVQHSYVIPRGKQGVRKTNTAIPGLPARVLRLCSWRSARPRLSHRPTPNPAYDQTDAIRTAELCCLDFSRQGFDVEGRIQPHEGGLDGVADPWGSSVASVRPASASSCSCSCLRYRCCTPDAPKQKVEATVSSWMSDRRTETLRIADGVCCDGRTSFSRVRQAAPTRAPRSAPPASGTAAASAEKVDEIANTVPEDIKSSGN